MLEQEEPARRDNGGAMDVHTETLASGYPENREIHCVFSFFADAISFGDGRL
jgi:hypothetical protein